MATIGITMRETKKIAIRALYTLFTPCQPCFSFTPYKYATETSKSQYSKAKLQRVVTSTTALKTERRCGDDVSRTVDTKLPNFSG